MIMSEAHLSKCGSMINSEKNNNFYRYKRETIVTSFLTVVVENYVIPIFDRYKKKSSNILFECNNKKIFLQL